MKVLLIHPGKKEKKPRTPFALLTIAAYLRKHDIEVDLFDMRLWHDRNVQPLFSNYDIIGIHLKSGSMIESALEIAYSIRNTSPQTKIVFGGPHATFYPEQTAKSELVDYVVRGEGEQTMLELVETINRLNNNAEPDNLPEEIDGITYRQRKENGTYYIQSNNDRECVGMNDLPLPAYDLIGLNNYSDSVNLLQYETSRGCPHSCAFCYMSKMHNKKWRHKPNEKVISELKEIKEKYGISSVFFTDDNYFVNKKRALELSNLFIENNLEIKWFSQIRADYVKQYSGKELELIKRSGCEYLEIGAESGSQKILDYLDKNIKVEDIKESATRLSAVGIIPVFSFIIGTPAETDEDLKLTMELYKWLNNIKNVQVNGLFLYTPYPGNKLYGEAIRNGYKEKNSLEDWANWRFGVAENTPWLSKQRMKKLKTISSIGYLNSIHKRSRTYGKKYVWERLGKLTIPFYIAAYLLHLDGKIRMATGIYGLSPEWRPFDKIYQKKLGAG